MSLNDAVPTMGELEQRFGGDADALCAEHERLIEQILEEEEELITGHRRHIDEVVDLAKHEMVLLNDVDKPGSDVEAYVASLDRLLTQKIQMITGMRKRLIDFHTHLKTEELLSKLYQQHQAAQDASVNQLQSTPYQQQEDLMMGADSGYAEPFMGYQEDFNGGYFEGEMSEPVQEQPYYAEGDENPYGDEEMLLNDGGQPDGLMVQDYQEGDQY